MLPSFLVIGAPRSGTTWIHENLMKHPEIYVPPEKELHFFDRDYDLGIGHYEAYFERAGNARAIGETTPAYLHNAYTSRDVPALIKRHLPDVKLIASLRNPIDRAYSRYWNSIAKFSENEGLTFEEKLKDRPEFIEEGFYARQLDDFYKHFPSNQILVLLYDDIVNTPAEFMRRIYDFVGVNPDFDAGLGTVQINAAKGKKRLARSQTVWYLSKAIKFAGLFTIADKIRQWNSIGTPEMNPETRAELVHIYRDENARLGEMIGRDLQVWDR